ncbi:MAG TPA: DUF5677 domain-containing protein [Terriglobia bacterium]|nr:DUF5677 domain-containing protein [Terriglobia bacterium]
MEPFPQWKHEVPPIPHGLFNEILQVLVEFYKEHFRRDVKSGRLTPPEPFEMLRGFLVAAMQTYAAICILLAEKRPKRLMLQAGILDRALFEIFASVLALTQDPAARTQVLAREHFKGMAVHYNYLLKRFGSDPKWTQYLDVYRKGLAIIAKNLKLTPELERQPSRIPDQWPTPGVMVYGRKSRSLPPFVSGTRLAVLKELYEYHYSIQSAQAHGRAASFAAAMLVDDPALQWNPGQGESNLIATGLILMACILSEIESLGGYLNHPKLAELWRYLRELDDEAKELWQIRYEELSRRQKAI